MRAEPMEKLKEELGSNAEVFVANLTNPDDVKKDLEGMQTMRTLGKNMAWLIKSIDCAKKNGIDRPAAEDVVRTNFIR